MFRALFGRTFGDALCAWFPEPYERRLEREAVRVRVRKLHIVTLKEYNLSGRLVFRGDFFGGEVLPGARVTVSNFMCERCYDRRATVSGPKGVLDFTILPLFLVRHIRCHYCGDRYATFGFGMGRLVFKRSTTLFMRKLALVVLVATMVAGAVTLVFIR